jgi:ribonuclease P protein component
MKTDPTTYPAQVAFAVSKKNFKHAADRNRVKRLLREAYRLNKAGFYQQLSKHNLSLAVLFIYTAKNITTFNEAESKMKVALNRLIQAYAPGG